MLDKLRREKGKEVTLKELIRVTLVITIAFISLTYGLQSANGRVEKVENIVGKNKEVEQVVNETTEQISEEVLVSTIPTVVEEVVNELEKAMKQGVEADTEELLNKLFDDGYTLAREGIELQDIYENYKIVGISFGDKKIFVEKELITEGI